MNAQFAPVTLYSIYFNHTRVQNSHQPPTSLNHTLMYLKKKNINITEDILDSSPAPGEDVNLLWIISNPHAATLPPVLIKSQPYKIMKIPGTAFILLLTEIYFSSTKNV